MPLLGSRGAASLTGFGGLAKLGYLLRNSLRFRASANSHLSRTFAAGNQQKFTLSLWAKRGSGGMGRIFTCGSSGSSYFQFRFDADDNILISSENPSLVMSLSTTQVFRDPAAWYHIVLSIDTTQATSSNRVKLYVNGSQVTAFSGTSYPSQNTNLLANSNIAHYFGALSYATSESPFDGYLTEINFIDGQQLDSSSFGKTDSATGQWIPKKFGGAYGTNGFYLPFTNTTSTSTLGNDFSGNGNTWTVNNISLTAGATYDAMTDVPTLTSATAANYCVINTTTTQPTGWQVASAFSNGGLTSTIASAASDGAAYGTIALPRSGKWYWEVTITDSTVPGAVGISESSMARPDSTGPICRMLYSGGGTGASFASDGNTTSGSYTYFSNATLSVACDMDNGAFYFAVNGTYINSGVPTSGASKTGAIFTDLLSASPGGGSWLPMSYGYNGHVHHHNYGQRPFAYSVPSGYKTLNTFNLP